MSPGRTASSLNCGAISPVFFFWVFFFFGGCCVCLLVPGMQSLTSYTLSKHSVSEPLPGLCQRVSGIHQKMGLYKKAMALASRFFLLLPLNGNMWAGRDSDGLRVIFLPGPPMQTSAAPSSAQLPARPYSLATGSAQTPRLALGGGATSGAGKGQEEGGGPLPSWSARTWPCAAAKSK